MIQRRVRTWAVLAAAFLLVGAGCAAGDDTPAQDSVAAAASSESASTVESSHDDQAAAEDPAHPEPDPSPAMDAGHDDQEAEHEDDGESGGDHDRSDGAEQADGDTASSEGGRPVEVVLTELAFSPASFEVSAGETVTFEVHNEGSIVHEFRLSNAHRIEEHIAEGHQGHGDEGHHGDEDGDVYIELEAGESGVLTVTFPEDQTVYTEVACLIPGHYESGMRGELTYVS